MSLRAEAKPSTVRYLAKQSFNRTGIATSPKKFGGIFQGPHNDKRENDFFLLVSRLVSYKRVDIAIAACNKLGLPLRIVGSGRELRKLKAMAGPTIEFLGNLTDSMLSRYYDGCSAFIYPSVEDFGVAVLEAQSFGKPVIAFKGGGTLETIVEQKTGEFFYPQTAGALAKVLATFDAAKYNRTDCIKNAERFSEERFKEEFRNMIQKYLQLVK